MGHLAILAVCLTALLIDQSRAHFLLNSPPTIGFDNSQEASAPCGSFTVDFSKDNVTDFHVNGDSIAMTSIHPMATWLFRATLDQTAMGNWTNLLPAVVQTGLGSYCERDIVVPATWAGSKGVIQVVQDAPDGILFQASPPFLLTRWWLSFRDSRDSLLMSGLAVLDRQLCRRVSAASHRLQQRDWPVCLLHGKEPLQSMSPLIKQSLKTAAFVWGVLCSAGMILGSKFHPAQAMLTSISLQTDPKLSSLPASIAPTSTSTGGGAKASEAQSAISNGGLSSVLGLFTVASVTLLVSLL